MKIWIDRLNEEKFRVSGFVESSCLVIKKSLLKMNTSFDSELHDCMFIDSPFNFLNPKYSITTQSRKCASMKMKIKQDIKEHDRKSSS